MRKEIDLDTPISDEQKIKLEKLRHTTPIPDKDCPELTDEQLANRIDQAIFEAEQEFAENGEVIDAKVAFEELEKKYFG